MAFQTLREPKKQTVGQVYDVPILDLLSLKGRELYRSLVEKNGKKGKVVNLMLADETGQIRLSLWNEQVKLVEESQIKEGVVIEITNGYT